MDWATARAAADVLLRWDEGELHVGFSGGEPLLAEGLMRRVVDHLERRRSGTTSIDYVLTTNGTLLSPITIAFLVERGVRLHLSFDGVRQAQDLRGPETFDILDALLHRLRAEQPDYFERMLAVGVTVTAAALPFLAASTRYFIERGVSTIEFAPVVTWDEDCDEASVVGLSEQIAAILEIAVDHWYRTRECPVSFLRPVEPTGEVLLRPVFGCGACAGIGVTVDADGRAWGCQLFAASLQELPLLGRSVARALDLGDIRDPSIDRRLAALPSIGLVEPVLGALDTKYTSYGRCCDCEHLYSCTICPAGTIHIPGNTDPLRLPDLPCAFSRLTLEAAAEFERSTASQRWVDRLVDLKQPLQQLMKNQRSQS